MSIGRIVNRLLRPLGLQVSRRSGDNDYDSYMTTPHLARRLREEVGDVTHRALTSVDAFPVPDRAGVQALVDAFFELYPSRPVAKNFNGSGFDNCLWLYLVARCIEPELVVESGVQRGQTTWVLRQACPDAEFHCFDINLSRLVYRDPRATYVERDWETRPFEGVDGARSLGFFDDHQNQAKRVRQAHDRGFRHLLFDDTVPVHKIYADGEPPLPTVSMLLDPLAVVGETYEWVCHGTAHRYHYTEADTHGARALIRDLVAFPDTSHITRHGRSSFPTYVRLVD